METAEFTPQVPGLVFDESFKGCSVVVLETERLQRGDRVRIRAGELPVLKAEVRWRREIDTGVLKVGFLYVE